jgi:hypothetical protein
MTRLYKLSFTLLSTILALIICACTASLVPEDIKQEMIDDALFTLDVLSGNSYKSSVTSTSLKITGAGKPLPVELNSGVEEVVCYKVYIDYTRKGADHEAIFHGLAKKTGELWVVNVDYENTWKRHSCPGDYESSDIP